MLPLLVLEACFSAKLERYREDLLCLIVSASDIAEDDACYRNAVSVSVKYATLKNCA